jgi:hypothetical protein
MEKLSPSEKIRRMYFAVGLAMTQWQQVEQALTQLFTILVHTGDGTASAVFNSVTPVRTRLDMIRAAAAVRLPTSELGDLHRPGLEPGPFLRTRHALRCFVEHDPHHLIAAA